MKPITWGALLGLAVVLVFLLSIRLGSVDLSTGEVFAALFGEGQSRIVVSLAPEHRAKLEHIATELRVPLMELGVTGGDRFQLGPMLDLTVREIEEAWGGGLERALAGQGSF